MKEPNPNRTLKSAEIAAMLGISVHYLRDIIADRRRPRRDRRFATHTHELVPCCVEKRGQIRAWGPTLIAEIERMQHERRTP
jgi:hypothetical protein